MNDDVSTVVTMASPTQSLPEWLSFQSPGAVGGTERVPMPWDPLTGAEFAGEPLGQLAPLGELLPEALPQVVVDIVAPQKVLERFYCIFRVLGEKVTDTSPFSYFLA